MINIRKINTNDAAALFLFLERLESESPYLLYNPGERTMSLMTLQKKLLQLEDNQHSVLFIAENNAGNIIGFIGGEAGQFQRTAHVMKVNIGLLKKYQGKETTKNLCHQLLAYAKTQHITRFEATVIKENQACINLCLKMGYEIEGIKRAAIKIDNDFHDEYFLACILGGK